jgi:hypothetical protein
MKAGILAGALAALLVGPLAAAQVAEPREEGADIGVAEDFVQGDQEQGTSQPSEQLPHEEPGIGGSGDVGINPDVGLGEQQSPLDAEPGIPIDEEEEGIGGAGFELESPGDRADMRGVTLLIGGGIEGYTGELAADVNPGAMAGVSATFRPSRVFGFEVGYSGAINEVDEGFAGIGDNGADIVRNGGHAALTLGLTATPIQPYALGGVGVNFYNIRNGEAVGFQDDTVGSVPVGLGVRSHIGGFTADARVQYNFLLGQQFAPTATDDTGGGYTGMINLGGTF